jgi:hypothetical protein
MNAPLRHPPWFETLPPSAPQHFALQFFSALLVLLQPLLAAAGSAAALRERLPFLGAYLDDIESTLQGHALTDALPPWRAALVAWEASSPPTLPLRRLMDHHGLGSADIGLLVLCGLAEEDPRLAALWALLQGEGHETLQPALAASLDLALPGSPRAALALGARRRAGNESVAARAVAMVGCGLGAGPRCTGAAPSAASRSAGAGAGLARRGPHAAGAARPAGQRPTQPAAGAGARGRPGGDRGLGRGGQGQRKRRPLERAAGHRRAAGRCRVDAAGR